MFVYSGDDKKILQAVAIANKLIFDEKLYSGIKENHLYDSSNATAADICRIMKTHRGNAVLVELFKPQGIDRIKYRKTQALFDKKHPDRFLINSRKLGRMSVESIVGTIVHEWVHVIDNKEEGFRFGHGSNSSHGKGMTVPYFAGKLAKRICQEYYHRTPIKKRRVRWFNPLTWF